ncbi:hypothetical protein WP3W18E06_01320 [Raoultella ornithinolytica]|nr:hypothetical protein WP3W18E06_01320 [Raoultella ornithinolytica]
MRKTNDFNDLDYEEAFLSNSCKRDKALTYALEIRKFEIELYWKRATYFLDFHWGKFGCIHCYSII